MKKINEICERYNIVLCYIFGSQVETGKALIDGKRVELTDTESDPA